MENNKTPSIRFKGFTDPWEQRKVFEIADRFDNLRVPVAANLRIPGNTPYYGANGIQDYVEGYTHDGEYILVAEDGASDLKNYPVNYVNGRIWVNNHAHVLQGKEKIANNKFLSYAMRLADIESVLVGGGRAKLNADIMMNLDIAIPSFNEQEQIGAYFSNLDNLITLHQRKYNKLLNVKKSMLEKMFPKNGSNIPEIRFKGFTDPWEQRKVSEVSEIVAGGTPSTSVSEYWEPKEVPWLSSGEVHKKYITYTDDMISKNGLANSSAKIIKKNSVLIALAGQGKTRGTVAINRISLSTNQSIAAMSFNDDIVPEFVFSNLENRYDEIRAMSSGDGSRGGLNKQLVGDITIPYTIKEEQQKIGQYFSNLDHLITLHQRELEKLQNIKKSMLEKMFV